MSPLPNRAYTTLGPGERLETLAARTLPDEPLDQAIDKIKSWNLHIFAIRKPPMLLGSDIVFVEPPLRASGCGLYAATVRDAAGA